MSEFISTQPFIYARTDNVWRPVDRPYSKVNDTYRHNPNIHVKVDNTYRHFLMPLGRRVVLKNSYYMSPINNYWTNQKFLYRAIYMSDGLYQQGYYDFNGSFSIGNKTIPGQQLMSLGQLSGNGQVVFNGQEIVRDMRLYVHASYQGNQTSEFIINTFNGTYDANAAYDRFWNVINRLVLLKV